LKIIGNADKIVGGSERNRGLKIGVVFVIEWMRCG